MSNVDNNSVNNVSASGEESRLELYVNLEWKEVDFNGKAVQIPSDWDLQTLGSICSFRRGKGLSKKDLNDDGQFMCIHYGELFTKYGPEITSVISKTDVSQEGMVFSNEGDVLMPTSAEDAIGLSNASCISVAGVMLGGDILAISVNKEAVFPSFLSRVIRKDVSQISEIANGSTVYHVYSKGMANFTFRCPSVSEQSLIVKALSTQEAQVADLRKLAALERQRLTWLSDELLSGRLRVVEDPTAEPVVVSRDENGEPVEVLPGVKVVRNREWKTVELNGKEVGIPNDWSINTLRNLFRFVNGSAFKPSDWKSKGTKIVRIQNLSNPKAEYNYTNKKLSDFVAINSGDILMSWSGTIDIFRWGEGLAALNQHIFRVDIESETDNLFAEVILKKTIDHLRNQAHGATMIHIRKGAVEEAQCVTPPLPEQSLIAAVLTAQEKQAADIERLADLEQKRLEWLSDELLSGRLRIKVPA